jgi:hypothetical protein
MYRDSPLTSFRQTDSGLYVPSEVAGAWERVATNRYVAHAELGMSQVTLENPKLAWSAVSEIVSARQRRVRGLSYNIDGRDIRIADNVETFTFSDTVLLFTKGDEEDDLRSILIACDEMFSLLLSRGIPVRIGVAHGLFVFNLDEGVFVGPALVQAYRLGEEAQWLGAVLDQTVAERAAALQPPLQDMKELGLIVRWSVPLKSRRSASRAVLAWPRSHRRNLQVQPPIGVEQFYKAFEQFFGPWGALRPRERAKYKNTVQFVNAMLAT